MAFHIRGMTSFYCVYALYPKNTYEAAMQSLSMKECGRITYRERMSEIERRQKQIAPSFIMVDPNQGAIDAASVDELLWGNL